MMSGSTKKRLAVLSVSAVLVFTLSACGGSSTTGELTSADGASVSVSVDKASKASIQTTEEGLVVTLSGGEEIEARLINSAEADDLIRQNYDNGSFAEMSVGDGIGFGYDTADATAVHVLPVDATTYLYLSAEDADSIFDLESMMTFTSTAGASGSFADQVSKYGAGTNDEKQDIAVLEEEAPTGTEESYGEDSGSKGNANVDSDLVDPFAAD